MARSTQRCITCTPSDWRAIQALAAEAGMKTSPFIVSRVLGGGTRMALTADEQRRLHDRVARLVLVCEDLLRPLPGCEVTLGEAVAFLLRDRQAAQETAADRDGEQQPARPAEGRFREAPGPGGNDSR